MTNESHEWALILGSSSGFGAATAVELARSGMNVFGVHLDLRSTLPNAQRVVAEVEALGRRAVFFNTNAADADKRAAVLSSIRETLRSRATTPTCACSCTRWRSGRWCRTSPRTRRSAVSQRQMEMTLDVMANSLVYWVQDLVALGLMRRGSRVFAMTSSGSTRVIKNYGPVSAAKAALESHVRQLACELAPQGIAVNAIRAGITDTPAMRKIAGAVGAATSGRRRRTRAAARRRWRTWRRRIAALCDERLYWMTGNVIGVDGGEEITA